MDKELIDRAWACLPREFKEEVKKVFEEDKKFPYYSTTCGVTIAYHNEKGQRLIDLFGHHNLTSDAEGEDVLMCEKHKVQEFYQEALELIDRGERNNYLNDRLVGIGQKNVLYALFGSKCLPDDTKDDTKEPKFHVGQTVRCLNDGETYIVLAKVGKYHYALQGIEHDVYQDYLEPYTEPKDLNKSPETCTDDCSSPCPSQSRNLSQETENCDKSSDNPLRDNANHSKNHIVDNNEMVDRILKDSFRDHNRLHIAAMAMQGMLSNTTRFSSYEISDLVRISLNCADALLREAEKGGSDGED